MVTAHNIRNIYHLTNAFVSDEFARTLSLLTDQRFWWARTRKRGYVSLVRWLRKKDISYEECALVAIGIATRISDLHTRGVSQEDLRARDIFIMRRLGKVSVVDHDPEYPDISVFSDDFNRGVFL